MANREASVRRTAAKLTSDWSSGLDFPLDSFLSIYSPAIEWYDHSYHTHHMGHGAITNLRKAWLGANSDFKVETKAINIIPSGCVIQIINRGTFTRDVLTVRKATGKSFAYQTCLVVDIDEEGLVTKVEEYYSFLHDEGVEEEEYRQAKVVEPKI